MKIRFALCCAVLAAGPATGYVGPEWIEPDDDDAGSGAESAQTPTGEGGLEGIRGQLEGLTLAGGTPDLQDLYVICIDDPVAFQATTVELTGGFASGFDSRLYLFSLEGLGIIGNDDTALPSAVVAESTLGPAADDGTGAEVDLSGLYLLAITVKPLEPASAGGPVFVFESNTEISGPDGPGAGAPVTTWAPGPPGPGKEGACCLPDGTCEDDPPQEFCEVVLGGVFQGEGTTCSDVDCPEPSPTAGAVPVGEYRIALSGVCFPADVPVGACALQVPGSCKELTETDCAAAGGSFQGAGTSCCPADATGDGTVDLEDLAKLIVQWGRCEGFCLTDIDGDGEVGILDLIALILAWGECA